MRTTLYWEDFAYKGALSAFYSRMAKGEVVTVISRNLGIEMLEAWYACKVSSGVKLRIPVFNTDAVNQEILGRVGLQVSAPTLSDSLKFSAKSSGYEASIIQDGSVLPIEQAPVHTDNSFMLQIGNGPVGIHDRRQQRLYFARTLIRADAVSEEMHIISPAPENI